MNPIDSPPDWTQPLATEIVCPLCEYNLRGLTEPRCPECGFVFRWSEILDGQRFKHPYLFEHRNKRNIWSFWKTYWNDCRPRRFWMELNPAQPVNLRRLMVYWLLANSFILAIFPLTLIQSGVQLAQSNTRLRVVYSTMKMPRAQWLRINQYLPQPWTKRFFTELLDHIWQRNLSQVIAPAAMAVMWPWLTLAALMIFRASMRQAKINNLHVIRAAVYCCDFGFAILIVALMGSGFREDSGWLLVIAGVCAILTLYRLNFAYSRYLRFHLPFYTALASQLIVFLFVFIVLLQMGVLRSMLGWF